MVSIEDLALLYVREGRVADVKRLAEEIFPIFQAQDVHREAVAALMLFQDAARQEQLTVKAVREYARYLQEARTDPSLRFRQERPAWGRLGAPVSLPAFKALIPLLPPLCGRERRAGR